MAFADPFVSLMEAEITVQIPVLGRPHNAAPLIERLMSVSECKVVPIFICSRGDTEQIEACNATEAEVLIVSWEPGPGDFARKHNMCFGAFDYAPYVFLGADDLEFTRGWDLHVLAVARKSGAGVIGTQDDANPLVKRGKHSTHSLVSRSYIEQVGGTWHDGPGSVYHEGYDHQYVDTELCMAAMEREEWAFARRSLVRHHHPLYRSIERGKTPMDATYEKAMRGGKEDGVLFRERQARGRVRPGAAL